jgi:hypothetical protein
MRSARDRERSPDPESRCEDDEPSRLDPVRGGGLLFCHSTGNSH